MMNDEYDPVHEAELTLQAWNLAMAPRPRSENDIGFYEMLLEEATLLRLDPDLQEERPPQIPEDEWNELLEVFEYSDRVCEEKIRRQYGR